MKDYSKHYFRLLQGMALSVSDYIRNQKPIVIIVFLLVHSISIYAQDNTMPQSETLGDCVKILIFAS